MDYVLESRHVSQKTLLVLRIIFGIFAWINTAINAWMDGFLLFAFLTDVGVLAASLYFTAIVLAPQYGTLAGPLLAVAWSLEIGIMGFYWPIFYPIINLDLPLWYDISVHLLVPITMIVDVAFNKIRIVYSDVLYLAPVVGAYLCILVVATLHRGEIYPTISFQDLYSLGWVGVFVVSISLAFVAGVKITEKRTAPTALIPHAASSTRKV
jgi:hypothetical protein